MQVSADLAPFLGAVDSIQAIVQKATTPQEAAVQAQALGVDPELVEELMRRLRSDEKRNFVQRSVTSREVAEALFGVLLDAEKGGRPAATALWSTTRQALNELNGRLRRAFGDLQAAVLELDGKVSPSLKQVGSVMLELYDAAYADRLAFHPNLEELAGILATGQGSEPWQLALAAAWAQTNPGRPVPTATDLEARLLDPVWFESLVARGPGPWETLRTQAEVQRAHRNVGEALADVQH